MKFLKLIFLLFFCVISAQNLPLLDLKNPVKNTSESINFKKIKLKENEICLSIYLIGGLMNHIFIDNFIFRNDGKVEYYKEEVYYKHGKKFKKKKINLSTEKQKEFLGIINSDFFKNFAKFTQEDFKYSENSHQICSKYSIDDAPENFITIVQNKMQTEIMVYLPKSNENCTEENSPLRQFIKIHKLFGVELER